MIPVRAPQDVTTLLRSMFAAVTPPRCESSSPHSTSTSALPRHSPSVPQHWRLSRLRPPRAVAAFPTPPALAHAFTPLRRQGAGTHFTAVFACPRCSIGSIPPHLAAASHPAAGRTTAAAAQCIARGPTPDTGILQDTAGYCGILLDTGHL